MNGDDKRGSSGRGRVSVQKVLLALTLLVYIIVFVPQAGLVLDYNVARQYNATIAIINTTLPAGSHGLAVSPDNGTGMYKVQLKGGCIDPPVVEKLAGEAVKGSKILQELGAGAGRLTLLLASSAVLLAAAGIAPLLAWRFRVPFARRGSRVPWWFWTGVLVYSLLLLSIAFWSGLFTPYCVPLRVRLLLSMLSLWVVVETVVGALLVFTRR